MRILEGSCHCRAVRFRLRSHTVYPYMRCCCSICRKTAGGGGYAINIMGIAESLEVTGARHISVYRAIDHDSGRRHQGQRHFCRHCGSALYLTDPRWPELVHPFASAIDTPLPRAPQHVDLMLAYKPEWVELSMLPDDARYDEYPELSIEAWHRRRGLYED